MEILKVDNLKKSFDGTPAVNGISFTIKQGEIFGLLGPNGAGKTTTTQMLLNVIEQDSGTITVFGMPLKKNREAILKRMSFSSSYVSLPWNLTVEENLQLFGRLYGVADLKKRIDEVCNQLKISSLRKSITGKLSSGQLTMLFLAKALINKPELILLDEPTASLDPDVADRVRTLLKQLVADQHTSLLYTSHNMQEMELMCDRLAFINHGKIIATGTPAEVIASYGRKNLEELFIHLTRHPEEAAS